MSNPKLNLNKLNKKDILKLWNWKCSHGHNGISHYGCYCREHGIEETVGFLDIEASNLHADFGVMLSWCIKPQTKKKILADVITIDDCDNSKFDYRIVKSCIEAMTKFDRIVTHYGDRFDIPFIRTRAIHWGLDFPRYGELMHTDVWRIARQKLRLHSNRQGSVAQTLLHEDIKTRVNPQIWMEVQMGSPKVRKAALRYILDHNKKDVIQLQGNYEHLVKYTKNSRRSI